MPRIVTTISTVSAGSRRPRGAVVLVNKLHDIAASCGIAGDLRPRRCAFRSPFYAQKTSDWRLARSEVVAVGLPFKLGTALTSPAQAILMIVVIMFFALMWVSPPFCNEKGSLSFTVGGTKQAGCFP